MWAFNPKTQVIYRVVKEFNQDGAPKLRVRNAFGAEWDADEQKLASYGFHKTLRAPRGTPEELK